MSGFLFPINEIHIAFAGVIAGLFIATSGALKDIRWEPFSWRKFWRTPIFSTIWAFVLPMAFNFDQWIIIMLCAGAMERITTEIYKLTRRKQPGKFADPDRDTEWYLKSPKDNPFGGKNDKK